MHLELFIQKIVSSILFWPIRPNKTALSRGMLMHVHLFMQSRYFLNSTSNFPVKLSLTIFILHRLRIKFVQPILLHQYSLGMCGPMKKPKVDICYCELISGPYDCQSDVLLHNHQHYKLLITIENKINPYDYLLKMITRNFYFRRTQA